MDSINATLEYEESDDEIFYGPVTKREVISRLKFYNLLTKDLLDPLNNYKDDDHLDENLFNFYNSIINDGGNQSNDTRFDMSDIEDSLENITTDNFNSEPAVPEKDTKSDQNICLESSVQEQIFSNILLESYKNEEHVESEMRCNVTVNESAVEEIEESCLSITSNLSNVSHGYSNSIDSSAVLNDTLEEMELLMKYGVNYMNKDQSVSSALENNVASGKEVENDIINISDSIRSNETKSPLQASVPRCGLENSAQSSITNSDKMTDRSCQSSNAGSMSKISHSDPSNSLTQSIKPDTYIVQCDRYMDIANRLHISQTKTPNSQMCFSTPASKQDPCSTSTPTIVKRTLFDRNEEHMIIHKNITNHTPAKLKTPDTCPKLKTPVFKHGNTFKVPSVTKVPSTKKSPNLKSIVSPIAMYIKNSPKVPLVKNVVSKQMYCALSGLNGKQAGEKAQGVQSVPSKHILPVRSYKPAARNIFVSKENEPALPGNIRKLIKGPLNPELIKHMGRVKDSPDRYPQAVPAIIQNNINLTMLSTSTASEGMFNISTGPPGDISVLVSKNAARTNCLQKP